MDIAALKGEMHTKEEEWKAEKARMDSIAREADRKHQQLADRTALVSILPVPDTWVYYVRKDLQISGLLYTSWRISQDRAGWRAAIECLLQHT